MGQLLILKWSWVQRQWWDWLALPTIASQWAHPCAPRVCRPWVLRAVCLNQWRCPSHSQSQLTVTLSNPEERCRGTTVFFFFLNQRFLFCFTFLGLYTWSIHWRCTVFVFFLAFVRSIDVPKNFTVKWATKTTVVLAWKFSESRFPYKCTVSLMQGKKIISTVSWAVKF